MDEDVSVEWLRATLLDNITRQYPNLTIIGAHLGNPEYALAGEIGRWNPNLFFDLSGSTLIKKQKDPVFFKSILWWSGWQALHGGRTGERLQKSVFASDVFGGELEKLDRSIERDVKVLNACGVSKEAQVNLFGGTLWKLLLKERR